MTNFPYEFDVVWPDGRRRHRPKDSERFTYGGRTYTWDNEIERWVDERGEIAKFGGQDDKHQYIYGYAGYVDDSSHNQEPKKVVIEKTEGEKLRDFFFPKNTQGCECGTWVTGSSRHSQNCKLYRDDQ